MRMRAGVLGEIEVILGDREIDVGPARRRCVLAVLLVEANRVVPVEELVRRVWDGAPPAKATASLRSHLSRLRMALMPEACAIVRRSGGYVLTMDESAVDIHHFRRLLLQARTAGDDQAAELFEEALRLWRGEPFAGLDNPWLAAVREAVRAERLAAELDYHDIELRRGRHGRLLATLWARAQEHPLNERLAAQLMLALYRDGRPADALACYQRIRDRLVDELGADPGLDLTRLHHRILTADPTLTPPAPRPRALVPAVREPSLHAFALARFAPPAPEAPARPAPATGRSDLPRDVSHFTGRTEELRRLLDDADDVTSAPVFAIDGMAGVGKTALAVHAAHRLGVRYPDGSLFLDLHGHTPGHEPLTSGAALDKLLRATGMPGAEIPDDLDERAAACSWFWTTPPTRPRSGRCFPARPAAAFWSPAAVAWSSWTPPRPFPWTFRRWTRRWPCSPASSATRVRGPSRPPPVRSWACAAGCRWRSAWWPRGCAAVRPGRWGTCRDDSGRSGWPRSPPVWRRRSRCRMSTSSRTSAGCSAF
ncbi:hypothetical protein Airi01_096700 [Actinoallomurus iriomotensis]|uniref:OmpR/PhoB-type domain-containing protein n=1 Tax=Actinoallomurus iriomotensis TaxID=478107 RepID=A0A9W6RTG5_9ACTN|nr:hypothetical protein Airi01_096700 [Actinoallomurus iriomotensis]